MARQRRPLVCFGLFRQEELMLSARQAGIRQTTGPDCKIEAFQ